MVLVPGASGCLMSLTAAPGARRLKCGFERVHNQPKMAIGAIRLNKTERRRVTGPAGSELLARWLNLPRSRSDQRAGQSPEAKNENRPPVLSRRPLPHARRARHAD